MLRPTCPPLVRGLCERTGLTQEKFAAKDEIVGGATALPGRLLNKSVRIPAGFFAIFFDRDVAGIISYVNSECCIFAILDQILLKSRYVFNRSVITITKKQETRQ